VGIAHEFDYEVIAFAFRQPPPEQQLALISQRFRVQII
jgi:hypothetical protein